MSDQGAEKLHILSKWSRGGGLGCELVANFEMARVCGGGGAKTYVLTTTLIRASRHAGRTAL